MGMTSPSVLEIDGKRFDDLEGFWNEVSRQLIPGADWGRNLDAFNDILRGRFGTPEAGFVLRWTNSERSRVALGFEETVRWLERKVERCHPDNVTAVRSDLSSTSSRPDRPASSGSTSRSASRTCCIKLDVDLRLVALACRYSSDTMKTPDYDVADAFVALELDEQVPEAGDVEVGPVGEHALDERDQPRPKGVEVFVGVVNGLG